MTEPTPRMIVRMFDRQNGLCFYCSGGMTLVRGQATSATRDHIIPQRKGGSGPENIVAACWSCNNAKGSMTAEQFKARVSQHAFRVLTGWPRAPGFGQQRRADKKRRRAIVRQLQKDGVIQRIGTPSTTGA